MQGYCILHQIHMHNFHMYKQFSSPCQGLIENLLMCTSIQYSLCEHMGYMGSLESCICIQDSLCHAHDCKMILFHLLPMNTGLFYTIHYTVSMGFLNITHMASLCYGHNDACRIPKDGNLCAVMHMNTRCFVLCEQLNILGFLCYSNKPVHGFLGFVMNAGKLLKSALPLK
jgi:hypothetical protein